MISFPVTFHPFGLSLPSHMAFEILAYAIGFRLYTHYRPRFPRTLINFDQNLWLLTACVLGAAIGSKLVAWLESPLDYWQHHRDFHALLGGKSIVGGLLGGWAGVEIAKRRLHIQQSTGDAYVFPLIIGMSIGRIGCFLTGLDDHTCGQYTTLPRAVNFGDGPRHPTQLYEIIFLLTLALALAVRMRTPFENGRLFRLFLFWYLTYRFAVEFIHYPRWNPWLGLSAIQVICLGGATLLTVLLLKGRQPAHEP